jgi:ABC-type nitrate/sulfonate/bicarbonate transport system substrate-binding protein
MRASIFGLFPAGMAASFPAFAQDTSVAIGISGWTGFAPLTLAKEAGIFKKNGLDVSLKKVPQASRHLAIQSGDIQCAANPKPGRSAPGTSRTKELGSFSTQELTFVEWSECERLTEAVH